MRWSFLSLAISFSAAACGGLVDTTSDGNSNSIPLPPSVPGQTNLPASPPGPPAVVASGLGTPSAIALANEQVVIAMKTTVLEGEEAEVGSVFVSDKRTGPALMIALDHAGATYGALATDGASAFVAASDGRVLRVPLMGGDGETIATLDAPATALAATSTHVYFATNTGAVGRVPQMGGDPEPLGAATGAVRALATDDAAVYAADANGIMRIALATHDARPIATNAGAPCAMIRSGSRLFFTASQDVGESAILRAGIDGGDVATVASGAFAACAIAADDGSLYFATAAPRAPSFPKSAAGLGVMRAPIGGGAAEPLAGAADAIAEPGALAVDATNIYWMTSSAVLRMQK